MSHKRTWMPLWVPFLWPLPSLLLYAPFLERTEFRRAKACVIHVKGRNRSYFSRAFRNLSILCFCFEIVITCILLFQEWMEAIKKFCGKVMNTTVGERDVKQLRSLEVNVVEAHSSNKVSHPYCMISLNEVKTCRTKTQEGHSPIWNEEFKFKWVNWFWIWPHTFAFLCSSITVEPRHKGHLVERFKQESMCGPSAKKVAASESSIVLHSLS